MAIFRRKKSTPTRQVTGTSYSTKGATNLKPADLREQGSSAGSGLVDPVPALITDYQASRTYTEMIRSDASVRTSLRAGKAPVLGADYFIDPASDDPQDLMIAEFVEYNLFNGMTTPFLRTMENILKFFENPRGNSVFELVWEEREWTPKYSYEGSGTPNLKKHTMLQKLAYRPPETITEWLRDDNGGPAGIKQLATRSDNSQEEVDIGIEKLAIFTFDPDGGSVFGKSILRSAYRNWYYKDRFYAIDGVQKERHGIGVPRGKLLAGYDNEDKEYLINVLRNLRTNENAFFVENPKFEISFAEVPGNVVDALESAQHHDTMIMKNIMVQFLNAGMDNSGGGRSTSATAFDTFLKAMGYIAHSCCDIYNMYVIPPLVSHNFKTSKFPKLNVRGIGQTRDLAMFASAMLNLWKAGALDMDEPTKQWIRKMIDAPQQITVGTKSQTPTPAPTKLEPTEPKKNGKGNGKVSSRTELGFNMGKGPTQT